MAGIPIVTHIDRASFGFWNKEDIKKISVKKITEPKTFEKAGAHHPDGLYSPALGPIKYGEVCNTCKLNQFDCPGHYGHIELSVPVYHPMLVQTMYQILSKCCIECFHFRLSQPRLKLFLAQLEALNCGFDHLIEELDEIAFEMCKEDGEGDSYAHFALGKKLTARIQEEKEKIPDFDCQKRPQQRNIVERLSKLFRSFINGHIIKPAKICPNCGEKKVAISLHQSSVLVAGVNCTKPLDDLELAASKRRSKKKANITNAQRSEMLRYLKTDDRKFITSIGARFYLRNIWKNERRTMERIFHFLNIDTTATSTTSSQKKDDDPESELREKSDKEDSFVPVDLFFIDTILVAPSKFRPPMMQRGYSFEGPRTASLSSVMKQSVIVQELIEEFTKEVDEVEAELLQPKLQSKWRELQLLVNCLYDNEMDKYSKKLYPGLKQLIDKKEGLFRKNMMGKRVNFAARSVISPDPNILVDQIGVPMVFAKKLTYPQPVTPWNIETLREAVLNGPDKYPGAVSVVYQDGFTISLAKETTRQQVASRLTYASKQRRATKQDTAEATIVNRHLLTGDVLLFNRQPTLHKPSIMAFRARVLPNEKGFRLHYANCKSFNADFDGDEMNAHLPQSELARSEAYNIVSVNYQYLVPKDGSPLGGLIQDHVVAVCNLTKRDQFYDKDRYNQLVYCSLEFLGRPLKLEKPAILRPKVLWTGKQVISTIIKNCIPEGKLPPTLDIKSKIGPKILNIKPEFVDLSDCHVIIKNGELLLGYMDKSNVGATQYGLVHTCYELYGGQTSSNLMSAFARLSTWFLQLYEGFTLGIGDILLEEDADHDRTKLIQESLYVGPESAKEALNLSGLDVDEEKLEEKLRDAHSDRDPLPMKKLDAAMKTRTDKVSSEISSRCLPEGLIRRFPDNNLQMMIQSGAKGGTVNALQISCLLGQIELEGRRVPLSLSGRSLPSFKPYDTSPKAGGFVSGRFLTGIQPQEFFFHCMAGREGLIDTAVKTSRSGYLQRCLIKHLEGLTVHYDQTVRDSCGSVVQFLYGEDGLDITKCQMLKDKAFPLLVENHKIIGPGDEELEKISKGKESYEADVIARINDIQVWLEQNGEDRVRKLRGSGFLDFLASKLKEVHHTSGKKATTHSKDDASDEKLISKSQELGGKKQQFREEEKDGGRGELSTTQQQQQQHQQSHSIKKEGEQESTKVTKAKGTPIIGSQHHDQIFESWYALTFKEKKKWNKYWDLCPDPLTATMNPAAHFGVVPERLDERIEAFVKKNPQLVVDSASLICSTSALRAHQAGNVESFIACEENPELSRSILAHLNESGSSKARPKMTKHEFYNLCYNLYMKMLAQPGEAVGLLAAQSIGEPSTQMTLNTFHFAGRGEMNVTLGIPRLREILMTASAKIGTPSMDLPLLKVMKDELGNELDATAREEQAKAVRLAINAVRLSDVLEYVDITEKVIRQVDVAQIKHREIKGRGIKRSRGKDDLEDTSTGYIRYELTFVVLPSKYYKHEFKSKSATVIKFIEDVFKGQLTDAMTKRLKRLEKADELFDVGVKKGRKDQPDDKSKKKDSNNKNEEDLEELELDHYNAKAAAKEILKEEDGSSSEDGDDGEGDNTVQRLKSRRDQDLDYEEPENDDLLMDDGDAKAAEDEEGDREIYFDKDDEASRDATAATASGQQQVGEGEGEGADGEGEEKDIVECDSPVEKKKSNSKRSCTITISTKLTTTRIDMGSLVSSEAKRTYVHQVGNIQRAFLVKRGSKCEIKTEGVSLLSLVEFNQILDLNAIYTNDIHAIANTYGIEAASQAIRREMANVFAVYGIEVDGRHLSLIADYMTYNGSIRGMNRISMEASASPFQQMSYESTIRYLKWAAILGLYDDIKSPSASLVFGRPARGGTGSFSLLSGAKQNTESLLKFEASSRGESQQSGWGKQTGRTERMVVTEQQQQEEDEQW